MKTISLKNKIIGISFLTFATAMILISFVQTVYANPSYFAQPAKSGTATTTGTYMTVTPSVATTSPLVYDSYNISGTNQTNIGANDSADSLALLIYVNASSTATVYKTWISYSDGIDASGNFVNCVANPAGCDWYDNNLDTYAAGAITVATPNSYTYTYASSTPNQVLFDASESRGAKIIGIKSPLRYVRAIITLSGANGFASMKFVPKKQIK